jgi:hypothetical protein
VLWILLQLCRERRGGHSDLSNELANEHQRLLALHDEHALVYIVQLIYQYDFKLAYLPNLHLRTCNSTDCPQQRHARVILIETSKVPAAFNGTLSMLSQHLLHSGSPVLRVEDLKHR